MLNLDISKTGKILISSYIDIGKGAIHSLKVKDYSIHFIIYIGYKRHDFNINLDNFLLNNASTLNFTGLSSAFNKDANISFSCVLNYNLLLSKIEGSKKITKSIMHSQHGMKTSKLVVDSKGNYHIIFVDGGLRHVKTTILIVKYQLNIKHLNL